MARLSPPSTSLRATPSASATTFPARNAPQSSRASRARGSISSPTTARKSSLLRKQARYLLRKRWIRAHPLARGFVAMLHEATLQRRKIGFLMGDGNEADAAHLVLRFFSPGDPHRRARWIARVL